MGTAGVSHLYKYWTIGRQQIVTLLLHTQLTAKLYDDVKLCFVMDGLPPLTFINSFFLHRSMYRR